MKHELSSSSATPWGRLQQRVKTLVSGKRMFTGKPMKLGAVALLTALTSLGLASTFQPSPLQASDHDDGDIDVRSRALSLTDLYAFRERDQNPSAREGDLILVMNTNPRSLARQRYFFSTRARYEFRISRVNDRNSVPTTVPDSTIRFEFEPPQANGRQRMTVSFIGASGTTDVIRTTTGGTAIRTTDINEAPLLNTVNIRGQQVTIFAGLREDPFFFDVEQFFRVRAGALGFGPAVGFRSPAQAQDFAKGYNVNTIVMRVPRALLQGRSNATTFDVWLSLLIPNPTTGQFRQTEQLARPGINEALLITQGNLAAYNRTQPTLSATPEVVAVGAEARATLLGLGNSSQRADALLAAFLPDVMRIDTLIPSGFASAANTNGSLVGGRKLSDDVIDAALTVLTNGAITTDNVSYEGYPGNPGQGHQPLAPSFPYLALPN